jgi:hypothetical protein
MREEQPVLTSGTDEGVKQRQPWSRPTLRGLSASQAEVSGNPAADAELHS